MDNYVSLREVLDNVTDHPRMKDVPFERVVYHTQSFLRKVGCPKLFIEKTAVIKIEEYRGLLPCDYLKVIQVRAADGEHNHKMYRASTDTFHMSDDKHDHCNLTYKIQGGVIFTSNKTGDIEMSYMAIALDDEGYPLIPDDPSFIDALGLYIKKQVFTVLYDMQQIPRAIYEQVCQDYAWAVRQAQNSLIMPSIDEMQALVNSLNTLVVRVTEHDHGFVNNGTQEKLKLGTYGRRYYN